jgi:hypothetical protein
LAAPDKFPLSPFVHGTAQKPPTKIYPVSRALDITASRWSARFTEEGAYGDAGQNDTTIIFIVQIRTGFIAATVEEPACDCINHAVPNA